MVIEPVDFVDCVLGKHPVDGSDGPQFYKLLQEELLLLVFGMMARAHDICGINIQSSIQESHQQCDCKIIMSNSENQSIQKQDKGEPQPQPPATPLDNQYQQLLEEGKQVLDSIPYHHGIHDDIFQIQRAGEARFDPSSRSGMEVEGQDRRDSEYKGFQHLGSVDERAPADNQSKNEIQNGPSLAKKASRLFVGCNCIKSKCTKNYCECFTQARKCNQLCKCTGCENRGDSQKKYRTSFELEETERVCYCKKSNCLKKYCQCFNSGLKCTSACKCEECKNCQDDPADPEEGCDQPKEEPKKVRSPEEIRDINAKIDQIARLVPKEQQEHLLSFLEYWLS